MQGLVSDVMNIKRDFSKTPLYFLLLSWVVNLQKKTGFSQISVNNFKPITPAKTWNIYTYKTKNSSTVS